jgi:hypothetical protein
MDIAALSSLWSFEVRGGLSDVQKLFEELHGCDGTFRVPVSVATNVNLEDIPNFNS